MMNREREVVYVDRFHRLDWSIQIQRIKAACDRYNEASVLIDTTGAGEPVYEALQKANVNCRAYPFTAKSKSALIDNLALHFEKGEITIPTPQLWPEGVEELESFEYSISDAGNVKTGSPSGMHDDCVISLSLAAWAAKSIMPMSVRIARVGGVSPTLGSSLR
jgi:hypothetical protein